VKIDKMGSKEDNTKKKKLENRNEHSALIKENDLS
jgi:hypothetical protein